MKTTHTPGREHRFPQKLLAIPHELVCFVAFWAFAWLWYGEVFAMARGYSFFSSDPLLMRPVLDRALGGLWVMGRAWLNLFAYPWLGSAALAFLLAIGSWLFGKVAFLPRRWQAAQYLDNKELAFIQNLRPDFDLFESFFISPLFIGFPLAKFQAENPVRREMSTAAALYTKNMPVFLGQASYYLRQPSFPPVVGDALGLAYANNQLGGMDARPLMPYTERLMAFTRDLGPADPLQARDPGHTLFHKYRGFYPYYYFFGNRNLKPDARTPEKEKGGVN